MKVLPVDQAVITQALVAAADEMGIKLIRSAHSPVVREAQDCSAAILDRQGRVVSQADLIPIQLGSVTHTFRACLEHHPLETLEDGDFLINNDPYSGGQHLPDIFLFSPIFLDEVLIGITATVVHHIDLGGGAPGLNPDAGDVHGEGITFPPSRYSVERDWNSDPAHGACRPLQRLRPHFFAVGCAVATMGVERRRKPIWSSPWHRRRGPLQSRTAMTAHR